MAILKISVLEVSGEVFIRLPNGELKELNLGDLVDADAEIVTGANGTVTLSADGQQHIIPSNQTVSLSESLLFEATPGSEQFVQNDDSVDDLLAELNEPQATSEFNQEFLDALEGDGDLLDNLEATAAGATGGGGADGGSSFVRVNRVDENVDPLAFNFETVADEDPEIEPQLANSSDNTESDDVSGEPIVLTIDDIGQINNTTPTVTGTTNAPADSTVDIVITDSDGNVQNVTAVVQADESFSADIPNVVSEGTFDITATLTDSTGTTTTSNSSGTIDTQEPDLVIDTPTFNNEQTPTISGNTDLTQDSIVDIAVTDSNGDEQTFTASVQPDGSFSADVPNVLPDGDFTIEVTATDEAGNVTSTSFTGNVDATAPVITFDTPTSGSSTTPTISGTTDLPAGDTISITVTDSNDNQQTFTTDIQPDGSFSTVVPNELPEGEYTIAITATDEAGNISTTVSTGNVDITTPIITFDDINNTQSPTISGTTDLPAGDTISITVTDSNDNQQTFTTDIQPDGSFSTVVPNELPEGEYTIAITATDEAGNSSTTLSTGNVDTTAPIITFDDINNTQSPTISGTTDLPAGDTISITVTDSNDDQQTFTTDIQPDGFFSTVVPNELPEGEYTIAITATDEAGNTSTTLSTGNVDTAAPTIILEISASSNDVTPTISGESSLANGSVIDISVTDSNGDVQNISAIVQPDGSFTAEVPNTLPDGEYSVDVSATDEAGNTSTTTFNGNIDTIAPTLTVNTPDSGNDTTPTISGNTDLDTGSTISIVVTDANGDEQAISATVQPDGSFSTVVPNELPDGEYSVDVSATDEAGNSSASTVAGNVNSNAPTITIDMPETGNDATPTISGDTDLGAGSTISIVITDSNGDEQTISATVQADGSFSVDIPNALPDGQYSVEVSATDDAGNSTTSTFNGNIDTTAPTISLDISNSSNDTTPIINGDTDLSAGNTVSITVTDNNGEEQTFTATVQADGSFSAEVPAALSEGDYNVVATATDQAGNSTDATIIGNVDITPPILTLDALASDNDTTPTITGNTDLAANSTVSITVTDSSGAEQTFTATVLLDGSFSADVPAALAEGNYNVVATATDPVGNAVDASEAGNVDITAPTLSLDAPGTGNDTTPTISGHTDLVVDSTVSITVTDSNGIEQTFTATVLLDGSFSADVPATLAEGSYTVNVIAIDPAGNSTDLSVDGAINSNVPDLTLNHIDVSNDTTPTISGDTDLTAGSTVTITVIDSNSVEQTFTATVQPDGSFSADVPLVMAEGIFTVDVIATDGAGNSATKTTSSEIDTTAPTITLDDNGTSNDTTPTITGDTDLVVGSSVSITVTDSNGDAQTFTTTVLLDNSFSVDVPAALAEGDYTVVATATDLAGNSTNASSTGNVDITLPILTLDVLGSDNDTTPTISGDTDLTAGSTVSITVTGSNGAEQTFTATVQPDGAFSADVPTPLAEGDYTVVATATDLAGNIVNASEAGTVDITPPILTLDALDSDNDTTPIISGDTDLSAGSTVSITVTDNNGDEQTFTATVQPDGSFSANVPASLAEGDYTVDATATDLAGNSAQASVDGNLDTTPPILTLDALTSDNDTTPTISGDTDLAAGSTVSITVTDSNGAEQTFTATVQPGGAFSANVPAVLSEGNYTVDAKATDLAGNSTNANTTGEVDITDPILSVSVEAETNSINPTISGTCNEIGATVSITITDGNGDEQTFTTTVLANETFTIDVPDAISEGLLNVEVSVLDGAGNLATASTSGLIDLTLPVLTLDPLSILNDSTPTISGTCDEVGATVSFLITDGNGDEQTFTTTVLANETFTIDVPDAISEGLLNVEVSVLDGAGNLATASTSGLIDLTLPVLAIDPLSILNDSTPTISGTCDEVGATVSFLITDGNGDEQTFTTTVLANETFTIDVPDAISEGLLNVEVSVLDGAGNLATASTSGLIDLTLPVLALDPLSILNDSTPTISGTCDEIGATVSFLITDGNGDEQTFTTTVLANETFTIDVPDAISEGLLNVEVSVLDGAGNLATASTSGLIDLTLPVLALDPLSILNNSTPTLSGTCDEVGATVSFLITDGNGDEQTFTTTVLANETFTIDVPDAISEGLLNVEVSVLDGAGNLATASTSGLIDLTLPVLALDPLSILNDSTPTISGTCDEIGATVSFLITDGNGDEQTFTTTVLANETFTIDVPDAISEGLLNVEVSVLDGAGNLATASTSGLIDLTLPVLALDPLSVLNNSTPTISGTCDEIGATVSFLITDGNGDEQTFTTTVLANETFTIDVPDAISEGLLNVEVSVLDGAGNLATASTSGLIDLTLPVLALDPLSILNDSTPTLSGTCDEIGATVSFLITDGNGDEQTFTTTVLANETFTIDVPDAISEGLLNVEVSVLDGAGNLATASTSGLIDLTLPVLALDPLSVLNNSTPTLSGTCDEIGATVSFLITDGNGDEQTFTTTVLANETFTIDVPDAISEGLLNVEVSVLDGAGNLATASTSGLIDLTLPVLALDPLSVLNNSTPTLSGTCDEIGATVSFLITDGNGDEQTFTTTVLANETFTIDVPDAISEGLLNVEVSVLDGAGNLATASTSGLIDLTLPVLALDPLSVLNNSTPTLSGTCDEIGATVSFLITDGNGDEQTFTTTVLANETFTIDIPDAISEGLLNVEVSVLDGAGNLATASTSGLIDLTLPVLALDPLSVLNNSTPTISGTCDEIGATVSFLITDGNGDEQTFTTTVLANETFTIDVPDAISEGLLNVEVSVLDGAGNLATASTSGLIDLTLPILALDPLSILNDSTPTLSGTCDEIGATVSFLITDGNGDEQTFTTTVLANETFTIDIPDAISEGLLNVEVSVLDGAGNLATASTSGLIDLTLPILALDPLSILNDSTPTLSGTCDEIGATVSFLITDGNGDEQTFTTTVLANETFTIDVPDAISEGLLNVEVSVLDGAGNLATASTSGLIDLTLPVLALDPLSILNDSTPTISGTCDEIGATVSFLITDGNGDEQTFTTTVLANETFTIDVPDAISEGLLNVEVSVLDGAGNLATASTSGLIDLTIPTLDVNVLGLLNDSTPTISGTSDEFGGTVSITATDFNGDEQTTSAIVDGSGNYATDLLFDVSEGLLNIDVSLFDSANNEATASTTGTIDTIAPNLAITSFPTLFSPILTGTTDTDMSGRTLNIDLAVKVLGVDVILELSTTVLANGTWSTGPIANLSLGPVTADVYIEDEAGNLATVSGSSTVTTNSSESIETSPFATSAIDASSGGSSSSTEQDIIKVITESAVTIDI